MVNKSFKIRQLQDEDIGEWFRLRKLLWDESTDEEQKIEMSDIYNHPETQLVLVAEKDGGSLIGFLEASIRPFVEDCHSDHVGYLEGWFVDESFRQSGVGRRLVEAAENWARDKGCQEMASDSEIGNELSFKAHLRLGYSETSRLVHLRKDLH